MVTIGRFTAQDCGTAIHSDGSTPVYIGYSHISGCGRAVHIDGPSRVDLVNISDYRANRRDWYRKMGFPEETPSKFISEALEMIAAMPYASHERRHAVLLNTDLVAWLNGHCGRWRFHDMYLNLLDMTRPEVHRKVMTILAQITGHDAYLQAYFKS